MDLLNDKPDI